ADRPCEAARRAPPSTSAGVSGNRQRRAHTDGRALAARQGGRRPLMDPLMSFFILVGLVGFGLLAGAGRPRDEMRNRRRWESTFYAESHREVHTDATGVL